MKGGSLHFKVSNRKQKWKTPEKSEPGTLASGVRIKVKFCLHEFTQGRTKKCTFLAHYHSGLGVDGSAKIQTLFGFRKPYKRSLMKNKICCTAFAAVFVWAVKLCFWRVCWAHLFNLHGGLICMAFHLSVIWSKLLDHNSYHKKVSYHIQ